jgi:hypothetical protein
MEKQSENEENIFFDVDGKEYCVEEMALERLLKDEVLFANEREVFYGGKSAGHTVVLYVNCNDVFAWGCADAENLPFEEIGNLYKMHVASPGWGSVKWCCKQRKQKPQKPVEAEMRKDGVWDEMMESLPENTMDREVHAALGIKLE